MEWFCKEVKILKSIEEQLSDYFKNGKFDRFVLAWIEKYEKLGRFGGKIVLKSLDYEEKEDLGGFLGIDVSDGILELTFYQFEKILCQTRFSGVNLLKVFEIWSGKPIYCRKVLNDFYKQNLMMFKERLLARYRNTKCEEWLIYYLENDKNVKRYFYRMQDYRSLVSNVCDALNQLPVYFSKYELLSVFAQSVTKDPHYFDEDIARDLLLKGIAYILKLPMSIETPQQILDMFYSAGLLKDDLSNYCYICHIRPIEEYKSWNGFYALYEPWNVNLYNLDQITSHFDKCDVYIFENPSVFRQMCSFIKEYHLDIGLISSNGQINICTYLLLDKLIVSGCHLYYAGDFDCEGLKIAQKLKERYGCHLSLWCYKKKYFNDIKIKQYDISKKRLKMLDQINDQDLMCIVNQIKETGSFGYQEGLIDVYKKELLKYQER